MLAVQLRDSGRYLWLGGDNPNHTTSAPTFVPMFHSWPDMFSYITFSYTVKGLSWATRACIRQRLLMDTGNTLVLLPDTGYVTFNSIVDAELAGYGLDQVTITSSECPPGAPSGECKVTCVLGVPHDHAEVDKRSPASRSRYKETRTTRLCSTASWSYTLPYAGPNNTTMWSCKVVSSGSSLGAIGAPLLRSFVTVFDIASCRTTACWTTTYSCLPLALN